MDDAGGGDGVLAVPLPGVAVVASVGAVSSLTNVGSEGAYAGK